MQTQPWTNAGICSILQTPFLRWRDDRGLIIRFYRGKSGLHRAVQGLMTPRREARNSGTERMSRAMSSLAGTGAFEGAAGVKTAKLCVEQDQIGER